MASGLLTKGITLEYKVPAGSFVALPDLMEIPDIVASVEKVEVTTFADANKRYISGIADYGDLNFKFLYGNGASDSYRLLKASEIADNLCEYKITFPDATTFIFSGYVNVKIDSNTVNGALTFTASVALNTAVVINP